MGAGLEEAQWTVAETSESCPEKRSGGVGLSWPTWMDKAGIKVLPLQRWWNPLVSSNPCCFPIDEPSKPDKTKQYDVQYDTDGTTEASIAELS